MNVPFLSLLVLLPAIGGVLLLFIGKEKESLVRQVALGISLLTFAVSLWMWWQFDPTSADYQFVEQKAWFPREFGITYHLGVDGISLLLVVLTTFLTPIALLCSWESVEKRDEQ